DFLDEERWFFFVLTGEFPTRASSDGAYGSRVVFEGLRDAVLVLRGLVGDSVVGVRGGLPVGVGDEYVRVMSRLAGGGGGVDFLGLFGDELVRLGGVQVGYSQKIMKAKIDMIFELGMLLVELAFLSAMAFFTGGVSLGQVALAKARTRLALLSVLYELLHRSHVVPGVAEALQEAFQDFLAQLTMLAVNKGDRRPAGIDWGDLGRSALFGFFTGGIVSGLHGGLGWLKPFGDGRVGREVNDGVRGAFSEGFGEGLGEFVTAGVLDGRWEWKWVTVGGAALSSVPEAVGAGVAVGVGVGLKGGLWKEGSFGGPRVLNSVGGSSGVDGGLVVGGADSAGTVLPAGTGRFAGGGAGTGTGTG
ncbi:hypothetical protein AB0D38_48710, partial [Streptomyces sp. NPDC048279]